MISKPSAPVIETTLKETFLTFTLGAESFAIPLDRVREITGYLDTAPIPKAPAFVKGIAFIRDVQMRILDTRLRLGMSATTHTEDTCTIVVQPDPARPERFGLLVDKVGDLLHATTPMNAPAGASVGKISEGGRTITLLELADFFMEVAVRAHAA